MVYQKIIPRLHCLDLLTVYVIAMLCSFCTEATLIVIGAILKECSLAYKLLFSVLQEACGQKLTALSLTWNCSLYNCSSAELFSTFQDLCDIIYIECGWESKQSA